VTEPAFTMIAEILPYQMPMIKELDLSSNPMNYFTFDYLQIAFKTGRTNLQKLNLSNTHMNEKSGIDLMDAILSFSKVKTLNLSRNMDLGYKFSAYVLVMLKNIDGF
jgi:hypothetical protein